MKPGKKSDSGESTEASLCPVCGERRWNPFLLSRDMYSGTAYRIERCSGCQLGRTVVDSQDMEDFYLVDGQADAGKRFAGVTEGLMRLLRRWRVNTVESFAPAAGQPGSILDVGCGRAVLLQQLAKRGWDVHGVELSEEIAATARKQLGERISTGQLTDMDFSPEQFDVVTFFHVLEHLPRPKQALTCAANWLAPGGRILVGLPNIQSWQARLYGSQWLHLDVPRHLWHFSPSTIRQLVDGSNLSVIEEQHFSLEYGPYGMFQGALSRLGLDNELFSTVLRPADGAGRSWRISLAKHVVLAGPIAAAAMLSMPAELLAAALRAGGAITMVLEKSNR